MKSFLLAAASVLALTGAAHADFVNPFAYPQPEDSSEFFTVVEIPQGSFTKYEIDADNGHIIVDRYQSMPVVYPANYGSIPSSLGGDGDPLDALVLTRAPLHPGVLIRFRPLGVLRMSDAGEADEKIIGVPADDVDPTYAGIRSIEDLPAIERERIEAFFRVYKDLPSGTHRVELRGWGDAAEAKALIRSAIEAAR